MLINYDEYKRMYEVEENLWWYNILHEKVLAVINSEAKSIQKQQLKILDAGCGTGGFLSRLKENGFTNSRGFDFSFDAVEFSKSRNLDVIQFDITKMSDVSQFDEASFDIVVSNDVLYQFDDDEINQILLGFSRIIKKDGLLITNNNAFNFFRGTHDIAVGSKRRFTLLDFKSHPIIKNHFEIVFSTYWSLFLSPLIFLVRFIQRLQLRLDLIDKATIKSDVEMPSKWLNTLFYKLNKIEEKLFKTSPLGSSLFLVLKRK